MIFSLNYMMKYSHLILFSTIILSIIYIIKINFFKSILKEIKKDKLFLILINILFLFIILNNNPFQTLVYYDEQNYVLQAQNIIEANRNALCFQKIDNNCLEYTTAPHGILLNTIYSLLYNYDFEIMSHNIAIFSIILYLINSLLMYTLANIIFKNKLISRISTIFVLSFPYNVIYASNIMPATICNFFMLIILIIISKLFEIKENRLSLINTKNTNKTIEKEHIISLFFISLLISMTRVEYIVPFIILLIPFLIYKIIFFKKRFFNNFEFFILLIPTILLISFIKYYKLNKFETSLSLNDFNLSYIQFFFSNWIYVILSIGFIIIIMKSLIKLYKKQYRNKDLFILINAFIFLIILGLYSLYRFKYVYRYLVPISSIFILLSTRQLYEFIKKILIKKHLVIIVIIIFMIISSFYFVNYSNSEKKMLLKTSNHNDLIYFIENNNLKNKLNDTSDNFIIEMKLPYLGQIQRLPNHLDNFNLVEYYLTKNRTIYYIDTDFERIEESAFSNKKEFLYKVAYHDPNNKHNIYQLLLNN